MARPTRFNRKTIAGMSDPHRPALIVARPTRTGGTGVFAVLPDDVIIAILKLSCCKKKELLSFCSTVCKGFVSYFAVPALWGDISMCSNDHCPPLFKDAFMCRLHSGTIPFSICHTMCFSTDVIDPPQLKGLLKAVQLTQLRSLGLSGKKLTDAVLSSIFKNAAFLGSLTSLCLPSIPLKLVYPEIPNLSNQVTAKGLKIVLEKASSRGP